MPIYECSGQSVRHIHGPVSAPDEAAAYEEFLSTHGVPPAWIGGRLVVGRCCSCGAVVFEGDRFDLSDDGECSCGICLVGTPGQLPMPAESLATD
jgi:hypothetical protein